MCEKSFLEKRAFGQKNLLLRVVLAFPIASMIGLVCISFDPTWWHARNYGLLTANPFGVRAFRDKAVKGSGDFQLKKGEFLTQRYLLLLHEGSFEGAKVEETWSSFTAGS